MTKKSEYYRKALPVDAPLFHRDHSRPVSRRDFIRQGFMTGSATMLSGGIFTLFAHPNQAQAALSSDMASLANEVSCDLGGLSGDSKIPFICFDLAGGANFAGSNVCVGGAGGQDDLNAIGTAGYSKLGLPGDMVPGLDSTNFTFPAPSGNGIPITSTNNDFISDQLGLKFHADSALLRGILDTVGTAAVGDVDGAIIPARSDNDTGNNTHNPLYGIAMTGASGDVVTLIGSRNSESGGNSMAPMNQINPEFRPTKVDRASDVTGMVDVGNLTGILNQPADVTAVMESMARITHKKLKSSGVSTGLSPSADEVIEDLVQCGYLKSADLADRFAGRDVNPITDPAITSIFTEAGLDVTADREFEKTASIMKMVLNGHSAGGCVTMGGYDYHGGTRSTGELRDRRAGRCIGACLNYAEKVQKPLMIYVFSDGSLASNGMPDNSADGRGKGQWSGDNSSTACSFFLVYNPGGAPSPIITSRQIGRFDNGASVVTSSSPAANNVNLLVDTLLLNYMALNGDEAAFDATFNHGLGSNFMDYVVFNPITT